jgi:hypothetical protein
MRALSASFKAHGAVRIQPNVMTIVAAALCVKKGKAEVA